MRNPSYRTAVVAGLFVFSAVNRLGAEHLQCAAPSEVGNGNMVVCWNEREAAARPRRDLLIHFHGSPAVVKEAFVRSELDAVLVVVNFPGLSTAYTKPFQADDRLFEEILQRAAVASSPADAGGETPWQHIWLSSFSAGYGAVREILKTPSRFNRIDAIIAADSIYAGLQPDQPGRQVDRQQMADFLRFAELAADGKKSFVISHSVLPTPYASTVETADYLLRSLRVPRESERAIRLQTMQQLSRASRGGLLVLGFDGMSGSDHMQHLRHIDLFWRRVPVEK